MRTLALLGCRREPPLTYCALQPGCGISSCLDNNGQDSHIIFTLSQQLDPTESVAFVPPYSHIF